MLQPRLAELGREEDAGNMGLSILQSQVHGLFLPGVHSPEWLPWGTGRMALDL